MELLTATSGNLAQQPQNHENLHPNPNSQTLHQNNEGNQANRIASICLSNQKDETNIKKPLTNELLDLTIVESSGPNIDPIKHNVPTSISMPLQNINHSIEASEKSFCSQNNRKYKLFEHPKYEIFRAVQMQRALSLLPSIQYQQNIQYPLSHIQQQEDQQVTISIAPIHAQAKRIPIFKNHTQQSVSNSNNPDPAMTVCNEVNPNGKQNFVKQEEIFQYRQHLQKFNILTNIEGQKNRNLQYSPRSRIYRIFKNDCPSQRSQHSILSQNQSLHPNENGVLQIMQEPINIGHNIQQYLKNQNISHIQTPQNSESQQKEGKIELQFQSNIFSEDNFNKSTRQTSYKQSHQQNNINFINNNEEMHHIISKQPQEIAAETVNKEEIKYMPVEPIKLQNIDHQLVRDGIVYSQKLIKDGQQENPSICL